MLPGSGPGTWIVRGFGTALMHGGTTGILAITAKTLAEVLGGREKPYSPLPAARSDERASRDAGVPRVGRPGSTAGSRADTAQHPPSSDPARIAPREAAAARSGVRERLMRAAAFLPGWLLAVSLHSGFNHFFVSPVASAAAVVVVLPALFLAVFSRGQKALVRWLDLGFDADTELLDLIGSGRLSESPVGRYLQEIRDRFRPEVVVDLICYLRLNVELALRAKGMLMMREAGFPADVDEETREKLAEIEALERSIGATGRLALAPFLHSGGRADWQLHILGK